MAKNGIVVITLENSSSIPAQYRVLGTMPAGLRPKSTVYGAINYSQYAGYVRVLPSGEVATFAPYSGDYSGQIVYCV